MDPNTISAIALSLGMGTIISKIVFDWLKNRPSNPQEKQEKIIICSLDKSGATTQIASTQEEVGEIKEFLVSMDNKITGGIKIAERNTEHYEEFIISLATLQNVSANVLKAVEATNGRMEKQTEQLIKLTSKL